MNDFLKFMHVKTFFRKMWELKAIKTTKIWFAKMINFILKKKLLIRVISKPNKKAITQFYSSCITIRGKR